MHLLQWFSLYEKMEIKETEKEERKNHQAQRTGE